MKKIFLSIVLLLILSFKSNAEIVYIDINQILNVSEVGKTLNLYIKKIRDENKAIYYKIETDLISKEKELLAQQNIIEKDAFNIKLNDLSKEIQKYRSDKKSSNDNINQINIEKTKKILNILNPIITKYVEINSISLVIPKKNIIVGKKNLDITDEIVKLLNNEVKSLDF